MAGSLPPPAEWKHRGTSDKPPHPSPTAIEIRGARANGLLSPALSSKGSKGGEPLQPLPKRPGFGRKLFSINASHSRICNMTFLEGRGIARREWNGGGRRDA